MAAPERTKGLKALPIFSPPSAELASLLGCCSGAVPDLTSLNHIHQENREFFL
jgi:hypothetical protein